MRTLTEFVIRTAELAEAEGRLAKRHAVEVIVAAMMWLAGTLIAVAAVIAFAAAIYVGLLSIMPKGAALAFIGMGMLFLAMGLIVMGRSMLRGMRWR